jgi:hypothetical protein
MPGLIPWGIWAASGAGSGASASAYELISTTVLSANQTTITFTNSGGWTPYKHLQIRAVTRNTNAAPSSTTNYGANGVIRFNSDATAGNYRAHYVQGDGAGVISGDYGASITCAYVPDFGGVWDSHTANSYGSFVVDILDWAGTKNKTIRALGGFVDGGKRIALSSTAWFSTATVTTITITEDGGSSGYKTGSRFSLYGLRG